MTCACGCGQNTSQKWSKLYTTKYICGHNPPWHKGKKTGLVPKSAFKKGQIAWNKGKGKNFPICPKCNEQKSYRAKNCRRCNTKQLIPWNKGRKVFAISGKNHYNWNGGLPRCSKCNRQLSSYVNKRWCRECWNKSDELKKQGAMSVLKQTNSKELTSIERKVYEELKSMGLLFETQKLINGKFVVDAYIPSLNLIIEADGDYWHSLEENVVRDKSKNTYLDKCGYNLLRLSESEINNGKFKDRLRRVIN